MASAIHLVMAKSETKKHSQQRLVATTVRRTTSRFDMSETGAEIVLTTKGYDERVTLAVAYRLAAEVMDVLADDDTPVKLTNGWCAPRVETIDSWRDEFGVTKTRVRVSMEAGHQRDVAAVETILNFVVDNSESFPEA